MTPSPGGRTTDRTGDGHRGRRPYAVLDIDGVLADVRHRLHHLSAPHKDWHGFFAGAVDDTPLPEGVRLAHRLAADHTVVYLSGRPEWLREVTQAWLAEHGLPAGRLLLRRGGDYRPARVLKLTELRRLARERPVALVVDDDEQVVATLRDAGIAVHHARWMTEESDADEAASLVQAQEQLGRT